MKTNAFEDSQIREGAGMLFGERHAPDWVSHLFLGILMVLCLSVGPVADAAAPNILLIYTDDHAQWAVGAYGNQEVHTPNMDRLAAEGMRFNAGFTKPVCSPSRAMLLTGLYSHRVGILDYIPYGNPGYPGTGLPAGTPTIASVLKSAGYATGLVGKWHLGYGEDFYPEKFGFDYAEGYRYVAPGRPRVRMEEVPFLLDGKEVAGFRNDPQHTDILADRAIDFIRKNEAGPFFLYLSIYLPHRPWDAVPEEDRAHYNGVPLTVPEPPAGKSFGSQKMVQETTRTYYANVTCADRNIGRVLQSLDELGIDDNTLVIFIGDNGYCIGQHGLHGKGNATFLHYDEDGSFTRGLGSRPNMFDDNVVVPFVVRWPGVVEPSSTSDALVSTIDILPTLAEVAGAREGAELKVDGHSLVPLLKQEADADWRDAYFDTYDMLYGRRAHMRMIRTDRWKLVLYRDKNEQPLDEGSRHELFDLKNDPKELNNLYGKPSANAVQRELESRLEKWMRLAEVIPTP
jgi:choline-sulfatase